MYRLPKPALYLTALVAVLLTALFGSAAAAQTERIVDFDSRIEIHTDGRVTVAERIRVVSARQKIKRGIYRDFPTAYQNRRGQRHRVGFNVLEVLRDGVSEPYHIKPIANGKRVYIGDKDVLLPPGTYTYTLTYRTDRQIGFFQDFDELYWNVTGNDWEFPIDRATATIELPSGAYALQTAAYTGRQGATGSDYQRTEAESGAIEFTTTRPLQPREGLTIAVAWPKGIVAEPTPSDRVGYALRDYGTSIVALGGLVLLLGYYLTAWFRVGRDPRAGTIIPRFKPPDGFSPAAVRHVMEMGFDHKSFAAAVVHLAVKDAVTISENDEGTYTIRRLDLPENAGLSRGELRVFRTLFGDRDQIVLENKNHRRIRKSIAALKKVMQGDYEKAFFMRNRSYFLPGILITAAILIALVLMARDVPTAGFMTIWLSIWLFGCSFLATRVINAWRTPSGSDGVIKRKAGAIFITLFSLPFFGGALGGLVVFSGAVSLIGVVIFMAAIGINLLFFNLLKAPTVFGRQIMDEIEGFKQYLSVAEAERLNLLNPPERTPELFERFLPYALALGVEQQWSEQFATLLQTASAEMQSGHRMPLAWYSGPSSSSLGLTGLTAGLGTALSSAVSSAATAPGSSSGSGGGGSSGGGGGGGGGGGW